MRVSICAYSRVFFGFFSERKQESVELTQGEGQLDKSGREGGFPISAASTFVIFYCHSVQMKSFFKDFDRVTKGLYQTTLITRTRFERVLTLVGVQRKLAS